MEKGGEAGPRSRDSVQPREHMTPACDQENSTHRHRKLTNLQAAHVVMCGRERMSPAMERRSQSMPWARAGPESRMPRSREAGKWFSSPAQQLRRHRERSFGFMWSSRSRTATTPWGQLWITWDQTLYGTGSNRIESAALSRSQCHIILRC